MLKTQEPTLKGYATFAIEPTKGYCIADVATKHPQASEKQVSGKLGEMVHFSRFSKKRESDVPREGETGLPASGGAAAPHIPPGYHYQGLWGVHLRAVTGNPLTLHPCPIRRGVGAPGPCLTLSAQSSSRCALRCQPGTGDAPDKR